MSETIEIKVTRSNGRGKYGKMAAYIMPDVKCNNRSRKVTAYDIQELREKAQKCIDKYYSPVVCLYEIDGLTIASNNEQNAASEYRRICDPARKNDFVIFLKPIPQ